MYTAFQNMSRSNVTLRPAGHFVNFHNPESSTRRIVHNKRHKLRVLPIGPFGDELAILPKQGSPLDFDVDRIIEVWM
jgi:hypothetical protein